MYLEDNYGDGYDHGKKSSSSGGSENSDSSSNSFDSSDIAYHAATRATSAKLTEIFGLEVKDSDVVK